MNVDFQRAVDRYVGVPLCALASLLDRVLPRRKAPPSPRSIVVILLSEMGSLVLAQPMFAALRARYPDASLHVMLFGKNREALDLMASVPPENVIVVDDRSLGGLARTLFTAVRTLRRLRPDAVLDCELFARISSLLSWVSGAPLRAGFHRHTQEGLYRGSFINRPVLYNPYRHLSLQFLTLARALESGTHPLDKESEDAGRLPAPVPAFLPGEAEAFAARLYGDFPRLAGRRLALVYASGGILPIRAWPVEHWRTLASGLVDEGYVVAIIGLPADKPLSRALEQAVGHPDCLDLSGYTKSVRELVALLGQAALLVTNDGGPAQFSSLTAVPTVALFGPETPRLYGPLGDHASCLHLALPCAPCLTAYNHRNSPCDGDNQCLKRIAPARVLAEARVVVARNRPDGAAGPA
jgi:ADP-heptose:LPS heptosyltransferase